ncbi:hypothetical protein KEM48_006321 [Puccinia striiformis f. sp. tritici PST-130]|nr:hypothetical protein KEM48_006321 [Puccinia striiformis f. sp. tritici PST-130]
MKTTPTSLQNGLMPTTVANLHSQLSTCGIPSGNSTFARSIHDFTRIVLGVEAANSDLPPAPPQSQLTTFVTPSNDALATGVILACFRSYLSEHDLSALELWKHWTFAKNNGFLHKYAISPTDDTADIGKLVLFRWVHGRQADLQKAARNLNWRQLKAARKTKQEEETAAITLTLTLLYVFTRALLQLSDHHFDTCVVLVVPAPLTRIFMNPACTSDTEEEDAGNLYRMHVPWRSQELSQFARKLDEATVERLRKEKGDRYVKRAKLLELR